MNRNFIFLLILLTLVICSSYALYVCSAEANRDVNTPTFELNLEPTHPTAWLGWRPEYKDNVSFIATLKGTTASNESVQFASATFTFHLGTPSQWEGVCMNYDGDTDTGTSYDLFIRRDDNPGGSGQTHTVTHPIVVPGEDVNVSGQPVEIGLGLTITGIGNSGTVSVRVNDHAAVSILSVSATFNYVDPLSGSTTPTGSANDTISIPLDNNGNDIADGWHPDPNNIDLLSSAIDKNVNYDPWADRENGPGVNMYTGDGFTIFEEYRGFYVRGSHTSIHPSRKDVFISSEMDEGIGNASGLPTPIVTHEINFDEAYQLPNPDPNAVPLFSPGSEDPWINFNSCGSLLTVVQQNALWVEKRGTDPIDDTLMGETSQPGPVHAVEYIRIFEEAIQDFDTNMSTERVDLGESLPTSVPQSASSRTSQIKSLTIGHEIGHGVGLFHPFDPILSSWRPAIARPRYHDRLRYNANFCQYESENPYRSPTVRHATPTRCQTSFSVWDSGSTIMDYGSETAIIAFIGSSGNRYSRTPAAYLAAFQQSTSYLANIHNVEYMVVEPSVLAVHRAKQLPNPQRKNKPQWTPPDGDDTGTSGSDDTNLDSQGTDTTLPHAPTDLSASYGDGQVRLSWTAASGTVTDYQYRYRVKDTTTWGDWISALLSNSEVLSDTEVLILSLINGTTYEFQVRAMNGESASTASDSFEETPATVPGAPTNLSGYGYNGWVSLSWTAPSDNGGATITDYEYRYSRTSQSFGSSWISAGGINTLKSVFGLTNGTQYKFQVRAKNSAGVSTESYTAYATPAGPPSAPQNFETTAGDGEVTLTWEVPLTNNGSTITGYKYSYRAGTSGYFSDWTDVGNVLSTTVSGLTNDTLYQFRVLATNGVGDGSWAGPEDETPEVPAVAPDAPTDLSASYGDGQISLSWTAPSSMGSSAITHYSDMESFRIYRLGING